MNEAATIPMNLWSKDHWSVLAYIESRCVDNDGVLDNRRMRCNVRMHRELVGLKPGGEPQDGSLYGTRLADGSVRMEHDDWSCVYDMINAKMLKMRTRFRKGHRANYFGGREAVIKLMPLGRQIAAALRDHKIAGGTFSTFSWPPKEGGDKRGIIISGVGAHGARESTKRIIPISSCDECKWCEYQRGKGHFLCTNPVNPHLLADEHSHIDLVSQIDEEKCPLRILDTEPKDSFQDKVKAQLEAVWVRAKNDRFDEPFDLDSFIEKTASAVVDEVYSTEVPHPTIRDMVAEYLRRHGYDGLYNFECGCLVDDLAPCSSLDMGCDFSCQPGYKVAASAEDLAEGYQWTVVSTLTTEEDANRNVVRKSLKKRETVSARAGND